MAYLLAVPTPQHAQGRVLLEMLHEGHAVTPVTIIGLNDFHGQLDPTTMLMDGINVPVGGAAELATLFDEERASYPGPALLLDPAVATGRFPQVSGLKVQLHCTGTTAVVDGVWKTPAGIGGPQIPIAPGDTVRLVTNDFMFTGGDGYTVLAAGTDVQQPGDALLDLVVEFVAVASAPPGAGVAPVVEGRIIGP